MRLYASPDYIKANGMPTSIEDMQDHRLICQNPQSAQVSAGMQLNQQLLAVVKTTLTVNNYFGVLQAVQSNLGIGVLPNYIIDGNPQFVRVLPDVESVEVPVFLAYPEELRQSKRVSAFRDFIQEEITEHRRSLRAMIEAS